MPMVNYFSGDYKLPYFQGKLFFNDIEYLQVEVLFSQLFPSDHNNGVPGATDAKAVRFLSRFLALDDEVYFKIPNWRESYRQGLPILNKACLDIFSRGITELTSQQTMELLIQLQKGELVLEDEFNQIEFFNMLLEHCIQGCFSDPRWGGNYNNYMWKWLGWIQPAEDIVFNKQAN